MSDDVLAINGGTPTRTESWPAWPIYDEREERALLDVLHSGQWWSVGGHKVPEFETAFARFQGAKHAVACTNGSAALEIALRALGIGCGDEVIVPPYTFIATASSVLAVSATPIFVDIDPVTFNMDPKCIFAAITPRTRAIIPVHIAGGPADMDGILEVARKHDLKVIEDAAQAVGAEWNGRRVGALGTCGTFSFQASKNLNSGEGGVMITDDESVADQLWSVTNVGRSRTGRWYEHQVLGGNFRLTEWQAAILLVQMERLETQIARRSACAAALMKHLKDIPGITPPSFAPGVTSHAWHLFIIRYDSNGFGGRSRDEFVQALCAEGIPASDGYVPLYKEAVFQKVKYGNKPFCMSGPTIDYACSSETCPETERLSRESVWLFQNVLLSEPSEMEQIADAIRRIQKAWS